MSYEPGGRPRLMLIICGFDLCHKYILYLYLYSDCAVASDVGSCADVAVERNVASTGSREELCVGEQQDTGTGDTGKTSFDTVTRRRIRECKSECKRRGAVRSLASALRVLLSSGGPDDDDARGGVDQAPIRGRGGSP